MCEGTVKHYAEDIERSNVCPACGKSDFTYDAGGIGEDIMVYGIVCTACNTVFPYRSASNEPINTEIDTADDDDIPW